MILVLGTDQGRAEVGSSQGAGGRPSSEGLTGTEIRSWAPTCSLRRHLIQLTSLSSDHMESILEAQRGPHRPTQVGPPV